MDLIIVLGIFILLITSELIINLTYKKYSNISANLEISGRETAENMLARNGVYDVSLRYIKGSLTDHYNSGNKTINLAKNSCETNTIAAIAVAAHETGHALQDKESFFMLKLRKILGPICSFASRFVWITIFIGFLLGMLNLVIIGIVLMGVTILFQLITLPVEFDASRRAIKYLSTVGYDEYTMDGVKKMLTAAAYTYVASTMAALLQMLRLILSIAKND